MLFEERAVDVCGSEWRLRSDGSGFIVDLRVEVLDDCGDRRLQEAFSLLRCSEAASLELRSSMVWPRLEISRSLASLSRTDWVRSPRSRSSLELRSLMRASCWRRMSFFCLMLSFFFVSC